MMDLLIKVVNVVSYIFSGNIISYMKTQKEKLLDIPKLVNAIENEMDIAKAFLKKAQAIGEDDQTNMNVMNLREMIFKIEDIIDDYKLIEREECLDQYLDEEICSSRGNNNNNDDNIDDDSSDDDDNNDDNNYNNNQNTNSNDNDNETTTTNTTTTTTITTTITNNNNEEISGTITTTTNNNTNSTTSTTITTTNNNTNRNNNSNRDNINCLEGIWETLSRRYKAIVRFKNEYGIAGRIVKIRKKMEKIKDGKSYEEYIFNSLEGASKSESVKNIHNPGFSPLYKDEEELVGFKERKKELLSKLDLEKKKKKNENGEFVLAVWGEPGVGKTTLARKVYEDEQVRKYFSCYAWITATTPYKRVDLLKCLFKQFISTSIIAEEGYLDYAPIDDLVTTTQDSEDNHAATIQRISEKVDKLQENEVIITNCLRNYLQRHHRDKGYFVVFDGVSEKEDLCKILKAALVPNQNKCSRIMITTRSQRIANYWKTSLLHGDGETYNLRVLSKENAKLLFDKNAFGNRGKCPWNIEKLRDTIVEECDGLPLIIEKVGANFSTTKKWMELYHEFQANPLSSWNKDDLLSTYHEMPSHLKPCFLYLCMFPKGKQLDRMRIVRLWVAEGFVEAKGHNTLEEAAEEYLNELVERGMIRFSKRDETRRNRIFRLPNMWYHIMLPRLENQRFCQVLPQKRSSGIQNECRRLSIHEHIPNTIIPPSARSILSFISPIAWPEQLSRATFRLKVLDLQDTNVDDIPESVGLLRNLNYLNLRNTKTKKLPNTIGGLENLQTLDLKHSSITELPLEIKKLRKLRHLLMGRHHDQIHMDPVRIPNEALQGFKDLQKLAFVDGSCDVFTRNLGYLVHLRRLAIVILNQINWETLCKALKKMKSLRSLSITIKEDEVEHVDLTFLEFSPPKFLERLYLRGPLKDKKLPRWIPELGHLAMLLLKNSKLENDPLEELRDTPDLLVLELENTYDGEILNFGDGFKSLHVLSIKNLDKLNTINANQNSLPVLRKVNIQDCTNLIRISSQIQKLKPAS